MSETNQIAEANRNYTEEDSGSGDQRSVSDKLPEIPESCQKAGDAIKQYVQENPVIATAVTFGVGLGVGVLATSVLRSSVSTGPSSMASRLGQMMLDKVGDVVPDSLLSKFNS